MINELIEKALKEVESPFFSDIADFLLKEIQDSEVLVTEIVREFVYDASEKIFIEKMRAAMQEMEEEKRGAKVEEEEKSE